ncbi:MAG: hypothetical protein AAF221_11710 [Pseudomonadota bacterium]
MTFSAALIAALALAVFFSLWLASRGGAASGSKSPDIDLVRRAKADLDAAIARGDVSADVARAEQADLRRRALAVSRIEDKQTALKTGPVKAELVAAAGFIAVCAIGFVLFAQPPESPPVTAQAFEAPPRGDAPTGDFEALMAQGQTRFGARDFRGSFDAYAAASRAQPERVGPWLAQGEALLAAQLGQVTPAAMLAFAQAERLSPGNPVSQYYVGLERLQQGDAAAARQIWTALKERSRPGAPWLAQVERGLSEASKQLGVEQAASDGGIGLEQIEGMVAGLAARLEEDGNDPTGWLMLARSYSVLNQPDEARNALKRLAELEDVPVDVAEQAAALTASLPAVK